MKEKIAKLLTQHAVLVLLGVFIFCVVTSLGLMHLQSNFGVRVWFAPGDPYLQAYDKYEKDFGTDDSIVIAIHSESGIFDPESVALINDLSDKMWFVKKVVRVDSLSTHSVTEGVNGDVVIEPVFKETTPEYLNERKKTIAKSDMLRSYLISEDLKTATIHAQLSPTNDNPNEYNVPVHQVHDLIKNLKNKGDHTFYVSGSAALNIAYSDISNHDVGVITPIMLAILLCILIWHFRSVSSSMLLIGVLGLTIATAFGIAGWLGITFNPMTSCLPQILISVTLAEGIHFLGAFFRMRTEGSSPREASYHAIVENLTPTFMTSITTALGFIVFITSDLKPIRDLGLLASIAIVISWLLTMIVMPIVLIYMPVKIHPKFKAQEAKKQVRIHAYLRWIHRHTKMILTVWVAMFIGSIYLSAKGKVNSDMISYFSENTEIKKASNFLSEHFGGARGVEILIDSGKVDGVKNIEFLSKVTAFQDWVRKQDRVTKVTSIVDIIEELNKVIDDKPEGGIATRLPASSNSVAQQLFLYSMSLPVGMTLNYWSTFDYRQMRMKVLWDIEDSELAQSNMDLIQDKAREMGLKATITGKAALRPGITHHIISTFNIANFESLMLITICMILMFRSVGIGFIAMIPNVIPPTFAGSIMWFLGIQFDVGTILVMSVVLGIAVDDTIHFLNAYMEEKRAGTPTYDAIVNVFGKTGVSITMTTVILVGSFSLAMFSDFMPYQNFGMLTAASLSLALIADLMLLPAIFFTLEKHPRIHDLFFKIKVEPKA